MNTPNWFDEPNGRRRFLTLIGTAAVTAAAGCIGNGPEDSGGIDDTDESDGSGRTDATDGSEGGDGTDTDDNEAVGSCDDTRGTLTPFDPGDRQFPLLFEYPDTFEEYNSRLNESKSGIGAQFGHVEWAESASYPVNLMVQQLKGSIPDEEVAENWVTGFDSGELIDWTITFDGEDIEVFDHTQPRTRPRGDSWSRLTNLRASVAWSCSSKMSDRSTRVSMNSRCSHRT